MCRKYYNMNQVFANDGILASTVRVYPDESDASIAVYAYAADGADTSLCAVSFANVNVYSLKNIWK